MTINFKTRYKRPESHAFIKTTEKVISGCIAEPTGCNLCLGNTISPKKQKIYGKIFTILTEFCTFEVLNIIKIVYLLNKIFFVNSFMISLKKFIVSIIGLQFLLLIITV